MDVDSAREDTRDVLEVSGEIQEKPSGRQGDRDWHYDEERYEDADHFSAVERRELYNGARTRGESGLVSVHRVRPTSGIAGIVSGVDRRLRELSVSRHLGDEGEAAMMPCLTPEAEPAALSGRGVVTGSRRRTAEATPTTRRDPLTAERKHRLHAADRAASRTVGSLSRPAEPRPAHADRPRSELRALIRDELYADAILPADGTGSFVSKLRSGDSEPTTWADRRRSAVVQNKNSMLADDGAVPSETVDIKVKSTRRHGNRHRRHRSSDDSSDTDGDRQPYGRSKRRWIRPPTFDGTLSYATFRAQFESAMSFNNCDEKEQLAHLKSCLTAAAAQILWDTSCEQTNTLSKLWKLLEDRFGGRKITERYRTELRARKRRSGESLNSLFLDIKRLIALGYQSESASSTVLDSLAKDCFIGALADDLALRVREKEPSTLDDALHVALRLEAIYSTVTSSTAGDDAVRSRNRLVRSSVATGGTDDTVSSAVLNKLNDIQSRFESEFKTMSDRMARMEAAGQRQQSGTPRPSAGSPSQSSGTTGAPTQFTASKDHSLKKGCFRCGDINHRVKDCTVDKLAAAGTRPSRSTSSATTEAAAAADPAEPVKSCGVNHPSANGCVYLPVSVHDRSFLALIDSGCELNLAPPSVLCNEKLMPVSQKVFAANGTPIEIKGRVQVQMVVGNRVIPTCVLISPDVTEIMLSCQWLSEQHCVWDFANHVLVVDGQSLSLCSKKSRSVSVCRRVYVEGDFVVPPRHEAIVPVRSTVDNLRVTSGNDWVIEPRQISTGVLLARTLLPDRHREVGVRVVNTTVAPHLLSKDMCLGTVSPAGEIFEIPETIVNCNSSTVVDNSVKTEVFVKPLAGDECDPVAELVSALPPELTDEQRGKAVDLLNRHESVFSRGEFDVGRTSLISHHINTQGHKPVRQPLRRHPIAYLDAIDDYVDQLQAHDIIEPSSGPWASNIVCVKRKDGRLRLCCDFRGVNARTYHDSYPLPNPDSLMDSLNGSSWFSTCDLRAGYHNIPVHEDDRDKTQIITRRGTWRWKLMPFGLSTSPSTCQRLMDLLFSGLSYQSVLTFLDDIIIFAKSFDELIERMDVVFGRLRAANLKLHAKKCHLFQRRVEFLGHVVSHAGIEVQKDKTEAVSDWPVPTNVSELRSFLGLASYYRRFVPSFSIVAAPLFELTRKGRKFEWTDEQQTAFDELKRRLTSAPILSAPTRDGTYSVSVDASTQGLGVVVEQSQNGCDRVIAYASRTLTASEKGYCTTRLEVLGVVYALKKFRHYLLGRRFTIKTDHASLQWIRRTPEPIPQTVRWLAFIEEFDFDVKHVPGSKNGHADALSRRPCRQCGRIDEETEDLATTEFADMFARRAGSSSDPDYRPRGADDPTRVMPSSESGKQDNFIWRVHTPAEIAELQQNDSDIGFIVRLRLESDEKPPFDVVRGQSENTRMYWSQWSQLIVHNGIVYRVLFDRTGQPTGRQLLTPIGLREELIKCVHEGLTGSHIGLARTTQQLSRRAWWRGWRADVRRFYKRCSRCNRYFRGKLPRRGPLQPTCVGDVLQVISIDLTGPHIRSKRGNVYILSVVDHWTKWAECFPLRNKEAETVARTLVERVFCRLGCPISVLSDLGQEVHSTIMKEVCKLLQIDKLNTSAYKPSTNAACERFHRSLNTLMGKVVASCQTDWDEHLPYVMAALRASRHESTGYSPNFLMLNREVRSPADLVYGLSDDNVHVTYDDFVESVRCRMRTAYDIVREHLGIAAERNKRYYDAKVRPIKYDVGDRVYYFNPRKYAGRSEKWARKYEPCTIIKLLTPVTVLLRRSQNSKAFVSHVDKVKPCFEAGNQSNFGNQRKPNQISQSVHLPHNSDENLEELRRSSRTSKPQSRLIEQC